MIPYFPGYPRSTKWSRSKHALHTDPHDGGERGQQQRDVTVLVVRWTVRGAARHTATRY